MRFYKGLFFPDGKPVPVGFERRNGENGLTREIRRLAENAELINFGYTDVQMKARTLLQNYASQRADGSIPGGIEFVGSYQAATQIDSSDAANIKLLNEYHTYLINSFVPQPADVSAEITAVSNQILVQATVNLSRTQVAYR